MLFPSTSSSRARGVSGKSSSPRGTALQEILGPPSTPLIEEYFRLYGSTLAEGQRAEVNLKALEWIEGVSRALRRGFVLTIDYGYQAVELYHPERGEGTLLCYFLHTTSPNPYQRVGHQDITAHVNFTALIKRGKPWVCKKLATPSSIDFWSPWVCFKRWKTSRKFLIDIPAPLF